MQNPIDGKQHYLAGTLTSVFNGIFNWMARLLG